MASIKQRIQDDVKTAMRAQDKERVSTLRMILAAIKQKEIDENIELDDVQTLAVLDKMVKQHRDSIAQYQQGGRTDLVDKETREMSFVQSYLPSPLTDTEVRELLQQVIQETGAKSISDMGKVMSVLKPKVQGRADMGRISGLVREKLSGS
jgi:uncharacterized protein YqeY